MATIRLVRHGAAAAGFGAHADPGLSEQGHAQAQAVCRVLSRLEPMPIYSSPLARAWQTAEPLAKAWNAQIIVEPRVAEIPSPSSVLTERAAWLANAMNGTWDALDAERQDWRAALGQCLAAQTQDAIFFSHYVAINAAVGYVTNDPRLRIFAPDNASVTILDNTDGRLRVISLGGDAPDTHIN